MPFLKNFQLSSFLTVVSESFLPWWIPSFMDAVIHSSMSSSYPSVSTCLYCRKRSCFGQIIRTSDMKDSCCNPSFVLSDLQENIMDFIADDLCISINPFIAFSLPQFRSGKRQAESQWCWRWRPQPGFYVTNLEVARSTQMGLICFDDVCILFNS